MSDPVRLHPSPTMTSYGEWRAHNLVDLWNAFVVVGQPVRYHGGPADPSGYVTRTRGPAIVRKLGLNTFAVVPIDGILHPVPIDHLQIIGATP